MCGCCGFAWPDEKETADKAKSEEKAEKAQVKARAKGQESEQEITKLFINSDPGAALTRRLREFRRTWAKLARFVADVRG
jgi:hypothetical protein